MRSCELTNAKAQTPLLPSRYSALQAVAHFALLHLGKSQQVKDSLYRFCLLGTSLFTGPLSWHCFAQAVGELEALNDFLVAIVDVVLRHI